MRKIGNFDTVEVIAKVCCIHFDQAQCRLLPPLRDQYKRLRCFPDVIVTHPAIAGIPQRREKGDSIRFAITSEDTVFIPMCKAK